MRLSPSTWMVSPVHKSSAMHVCVSGYYFSFDYFFHVYIPLVLYIQKQNSCAINRSDFVSYPFLSDVKNIFKIDVPPDITYCRIRCYKPPAVCRLLFPFKYAVMVRRTEKDTAHLPCRILQACKQVYSDSILQCRRESASVRRI